MNSLPQTPVPPHRAALAELLCQQKQISAHLSASLQVRLDGSPRPATQLSQEWTPLPGIPARLRVLAQLPLLAPGAWIAEAEYEDGAESGEISVAEAVRVLVLNGTFHLQRTATQAAHVAHPAGSSLELAHHETHRWRMEGAGRNLIIFTPLPETP